MSRLATLSSTIGTYLEAIKELSSLYVARGYPPELIKCWVKDNTSVRWRGRLGRPEPLGDVFVLKTHFNPIWGSFNVHELGRVVIDHWLEFLERQDDNNRRFAEWPAVRASDVYPASLDPESAPPLP